MAGGFFGSLFKLIGSQDKGGTNYNQATAYGPNSAGYKDYNSNAGQYGGYAEGLSNYQNKLTLAQGKADNRDAFRADSVNANHDYQHGLEARGQSQMAREGEANLAQQLTDRANGSGMSAAQMQAGQDMQRAQAAQMSAAASARGAGGMALAQQNAANNIANANAQISGQAQVNAANERNQAQQAAQTAYANMRQGDLATRQSDLANQQQNTQAAQFNAGLQQRNREANDQRVMGYENLYGRSNEVAMQGRLQAEQGQLQQQGILAGSYNNAQALNAGVAQNNANLRARRTDQAYEASGDLFDNTITGAAQWSDARAKVPVMISDTRAKKAALLEQGRRQGAAERDDVDYIKYGQTAHDADPAMLDDRARGSAAAEDVMDPMDFQRQLNGQVMQDRADLGGDQAANDAREASNRAEAAKIRARMAPSRAEMLGQGGGRPNTASPMQGFFGSLGQPQQQPAGPQMSGAQRFLTTLGGGGMVSDERAKQAAFLAGQQSVMAAKAGTQEPERMSHRQRMYASQVEPTGEDGVSVTKFDTPKNIGHEDQGRMDPRHRGYAQDLQDQSAVAEANRSMVGSPYAYKDGITPPGQAPGETNYGPMAQNLETNPVAATMVKTDPRTGLKVIDNQKALKVTMAGVADLQRQQDEMRSAMLAPGKAPAPKKKGK